MNQFRISYVNNTKKSRRTYTVGFFFFGAFGQ